MTSRSAAPAASTAASRWPRRSPARLREPGRRRTRRPPRPGAGVTARSAPATRDPQSRRRPRAAATAWPPRCPRCGTGRRPDLDDLTAVVTVADNGGSSGRLRGELGVLPPGDLRMALAALCGDDEWGRTWAGCSSTGSQGNGELHGHAVGNLLIVALWELLGEHVDGLDWVGRLLGARPRAADGRRTRWTSGAGARADPERPDDVDDGPRPGRGGDDRRAVDVGRAGARATRRPAPRRSRRSQAADWVVSGPGSWYTSVIPHLLVPALRRRARSDQRAPACSSLNLGAATGRDRRLRPERHLEVLAATPPTCRFDVVLADAASVPDRELADLQALGRAARAPTASTDVAPPVAARPDTTRCRLGRGRTPASWSRRWCDRKVFGFKRGRIGLMAMTAAVKDELAEPRHQDLLPQGRGLRDAAVRRRPAHRGRAHRGRGGARHRAPPAGCARHRRDLRPQLRAS